MKPAFKVAAGLMIALGGCASRVVSPLAIGRADEGHFGRHMGGGMHFGEVRRRNEGTWASDYAGLDPFHIIELRWSHSSRQGEDGIGAY